MYEPRPSATLPGTLDDQATEDPEPTDTPAVRRWKLRLSDRLGMGTFSATALSAYLMWSVVQGFDDMRITMREQATAIQGILVTLERVQATQRDTHERYAAWETQSQMRFNDLDGRFSVMRRDQEDTVRLMRDHADRIRLLETDRHPTAPAARR
jgi:hypothetical protein